MFIRFATANHESHLLLSLTLSRSHSLSCPAPTPHSHTPEARRSCVGRCTCASPCSSASQTQHLCDSERHTIADHRNTLRQRDMNHILLNLASHHRIDRRISTINITAHIKGASGCPMKVVTPETSTEARTIHIQHASHKEKRNSDLRIFPVRAESGQDHPQAARTIRKRQRPAATRHTPAESHPQAGRVAPYQEIFASHKGNFWVSLSGGPFLFDSAGVTTQPACRVIPE